MFSHLRVHELPPELREVIYDIVIRDHLESEEVQQPGDYEPAPVRDPLCFRDPSHIYPPFFFVSNLVHREAVPYMLKNFEVCLPSRDAVRQLSDLERSCIKRAAVRIVIDPVRYPEDVSYQSLDDSVGFALLPQCLMEISNMLPALTELEVCLEFCRSRDMSWYYADYLNYCAKSLDDIKITFRARHWSREQASTPCHLWSDAARDCGGPSGWGSRNDLGPRGFHSGFGSPGYHDTSKSCA